MSFTLIGESKQHARKEHKCTWCGQPIPVGTEYRRVRGIFEGDPQISKFHPECDEAATEDYRQWGEGFMPYENERPTKVAVSETEGKST